MPELPEVESVRSTLAPLVVGQTIRAVTVYNPALRWPIAATLPQQVQGQVVRSVGRRAKYLLLRTQAGALIIHLGMTGRLVRTPLGEPPARHDHVDIVLDDHLLRYHDPRRFGSMEWHPGSPESYPRFAKLGPEPLSADFSPQHLAKALRRRSAPIKAALMDSAVVAGLGNIYVSEVLHRAGVHPLSRACDLPPAQLEAITRQTAAVLQQAIAAGGSSLNDYVDAEGRPGSFQDQHRVYDREGQPCNTCGTAIENVTVGARASFYCPRCQRRQRQLKPRVLRRKGA